MHTTDPINIYFEGTRDKGDNTEQETGDNTEQKTGNLTLGEKCVIKGEEVTPGHFIYSNNNVVIIYGGVHGDMHLL